MVKQGTFSHFFIWITDTIFLVQNHFLKKNGTMVTIGRHQMFNVRQQDSKESHQVFDSYL